MTQTTLKVSVVIPTFNRCGSLLTLLGSLTTQSLPGNIKYLEVVVSIDGSTDGTVDALVNIQNSYLFPLKIVSGTNRGRAVARNEGVKAASGDLLVFFDDDVRPNRDSIKRIVDFHSANSDCILDGPVLYDLKENSGDFQRFRSEMETSWYVNSEKPIIKKTSSITGGNWSIPKDLFFKIGGLDPEMHDSEDFEFGFRAVHKFNIKMFQDYRTWVYHDDNKDLINYLNRMVNAYSSWGYLFEKHPDVLIYYCDKFKYRPAAWKKAVYFIFKLNAVRSIVDSKLFVKTVPINLRNMVYRICLTAIKPTA